MRVILFCHSLRSDWNHGNAHFLRGVCVELQRRGHDVVAYEPADAWSAAQLARAEGTEALETYRSQYPTLHPRVYRAESLDLEDALDAADLVLVHEWNTPDLVRRIGRVRSRGAGFRLLFHDTHHRSSSSTEEIGSLDLSGFDGVLAFGDAIRERYDRHGWSRRTWTWHEAADISVFYPRSGPRDAGELVWIGNWGDEERSAELATYLLEPARALGLSGHVYGVRYPPAAIEAVSRSGLAYAGRVANQSVPPVFASHRVTVHVPRQPYAASILGVPTIRVFEALACGIPLVSAPWHDTEGLFVEGRDFLMARSGAEMQRHLRDVLSDGNYADALARHGRRTIIKRHTCAHRVDELLAIAQELGARTVREEVV
ncbi:MAG: glycosyltransferase [Acidobacteria bacterium]|nr:glycosyltransferase [Acidobacteriota bacterium]